MSDSEIENMIVSLVEFKKECLKKPEVMEKQYEIPVLIKYNDFLEKILFM